MLPCFDLQLITIMRMMMRMPMIMRMTTITIIMLIMMMLKTQGLHGYESHSSQSCFFMVITIRVSMDARTRASPRPNSKKPASLSHPHRWVQLFNILIIIIVFILSANYDHEIMMTGKHAKSGAGGDVFLLKTSQPEGQLCLCK